MGCSYNYTPYRSFAEFFGSFPPVVLRAMISNNKGACLRDLLCIWYKASIANVCTFTSGILPRPSLPCVCSSMTLTNIYCHLLTNWQVLLCRARLPSRLYSGNGLPGVFCVRLAVCSACRSSFQKKSIFRKLLEDAPCLRSHTVGALSHALA